MKKFIDRIPLSIIIFTDILIANIACYPVIMVRIGNITIFDLLLTLIISILGEGIGILLWASFMHIVENKVLGKAITFKTLIKVACSGFILWSILSTILYLLSFYLLGSITTNELIFKLIRKFIISFIVGISIFKGVIQTNKYEKSSVINSIALIVSLFLIKII